MREKTSNKLIMIYIALCAIVTFGWCSCGPSQPYQYIQSPSGQQMVVVHDGGNDFLVDALIFSQLGYSGCVDHYHHFPAQYPRYTRSAYSNWQNVPRGSINNTAAQPSRVNSFQRIGNQAPVQFKNTTPNYVAPRTNSFQRSSSSPPSRPVFRNTSPSYSSPSRSNSFSRSSGGRH